MSVTAFPVNPDGRLVGRFMVDPPLFDVTEHKYSDHVETNLESPTAEYRAHLVYEITFASEAAALDAHYALAKQSESFSFTEPEGGGTHTETRYLEFKKSRRGNLYRYEITLRWWA